MGHHLAARGLPSATSRWVKALLEPMLRYVLILEACAVAGWGVFIWQRGGMSTASLEWLACSVSLLSILVPAILLTRRRDISVLRESACLRRLYVGLQWLILLAGLWLLFELVRWV